MTRPHARERRSIRLDGYDYTQPGAYFVTIVTADRANRFGDVVDGELRLNLVGELVRREWLRLPARFAGLAADAFVVMPNHVHGILLIGGGQDGRGGEAQGDESGRDGLAGSLRPSDADADGPLHVESGSVGAVVRAFKSSSTLRYHHTRGTGPGPLWQRNYYEHIVRGPGDLERVRAYILANPARWLEDRVYSDR